MEIAREPPLWRKWQSACYFIENMFCHFVTFITIPARLTAWTRVFPFRMSWFLRFLLNDCLTRMTEHKEETKFYLLNANLIYLKTFWVRISDKVQFYQTLNVRDMNLKQITINGQGARSQIGYLARIWCNSLNLNFISKPLNHGNCQDMVLINSHIDH